MDSVVDLLDPVPTSALPLNDKLRRLNVAEWERFQRDGFLVFRQLIPAAVREQMLAVTLTAKKNKPTQPCGTRWFVVV